MNTALNISKAVSTPSTRVRLREYSPQQKHIIEANLDKLRVSRFFALTSVEMAILQEIVYIAELENGQWPPGADVDIPTLASFLVRGEQKVKRAVVTLIRKGLLVPQQSGYSLRLPGIVAREGGQW